MEQLIKKIQKLREWEHLGLIATTGNTSNKGLNEFLLELENEALRLFAVVGRSEQLCQFECDERTSSATIQLNTKDYGKK